MSRLTNRKNLEPPKLVKQALELAELQGFAYSCTTEVGRLLSLLAGSARHALELGTGCGVGTAWITTGLGESARLTTIEMDASRAKLVRDLFANHQNVQVVTGDWVDVLEGQQFDFIFADIQSAKVGGAQKVVDALVVGGLVLLDDFTPFEHWPEKWKGQPDEVREFWLCHPQLLSTELRVAEKMSVILCRKIY